MKLQGIISASAFLAISQLTLYELSESIHNKNYYITAYHLLNTGFCIYGSYRAYKEYK